MKIKAILSLIVLLIAGAFSNLHAQGAPKKLAAMAVGDSEGDLGLISYTYDVNNRMTSIKSSSTVTEIDWSNFAKGEVLITFTSGAAKYQAVFNLDKQGRAIKSQLKNEKGLMVTNEYAYDKNGHLCSIKDIGVKENLPDGIYISPRETKFTYIDGALSSIVLTASDGSYDASVSFKNGETVNTGTFDLSWLLWPEDVTTVSIVDNAVMAGLLGKPINILPTSVYYYSYGDETEEAHINVTYRLGSDSYPQEITISSPENGESTAEFIWN